MPDIEIEINGNNDVEIELDNTSLTPPEIELETDERVLESIETTALYGPRGPKGDKGDKGDQGIQGIQGIQGETGATGNGISSIEKTSSSGLVDTYTITYTNSDTDTFDVTNGQNGTDGQDGVSPTAEVEQTAAGATITVTDASGTTTANITNGTDGQDGAAATISVGTVTTGNPGTSASITNSGTTSAAVFDFVIPRGDKGDTGSTGATGQDGFSPIATVSKSGSVTTFTVTDKNGTTQTQINDGTGTFTGGPEVIYPTTTTINFTNASGYTTNVGTVTSVNNTLPDVNGDVTLTIPTANDGILTITQNGTSKGTFSANQSTNDTIALTDTTYDAFTGADGTNAGSSGLVPAPSATDNNKYLKGDGTWASVSTSSGANTDLSNLTATGEAHFQEPLVSGTNIKTINNVSVLGNGNIDTSETFTIIYDVTTLQEIQDNIENKAILFKSSASSSTCYPAIAFSVPSGYQIRVFSGQYYTIYAVSSSGWTTGTQYDYQYTSNLVTSISSSSTDTKYPSAKSVIELLKTIYPVGSVYLSTNSTCPLSSLFGTWTLVSSGKALWTGTGSNGNTTIAAGLPNIKGKIQGETPTLSGAFTLSSSFSTKNTVGSTGSGAPTRGEISFSAASSNSIYSDSVTTVQPPAYVVNVWRRTA